MKIIIKNSGDETVIRFIGRLDTRNAVTANDEIQPILNSEMKNIVIECSELSYVSSAGLRIFLNLQSSANEKQGKLIIRNLFPDIKQVFELTGFSSLFNFE